MKPKKKLYASALTLLLTCSLLLSGCSGSIYTSFRELENIELVHTIGIDAADAGIAMSISSGNSDSSVSPIRMRCESPSLPEAMEDLQRYAAREELYYAHTSHILLGEEAAKNGIAAYLDYLERTAQMRLGVAMLVVRQGEAAPLVTSAGGKEHDITDILSSIQRDTEKFGSIRMFTCREIASALASRGAALICAITEVGVSNVIFDDSGKPSEGTTALTSGYAVIKDGALAGYVDREPAIAVNLFSGMSGASPMVLPDNNGENVSINLSAGSSKVSCEWDKEGLPERVIVDCEIKAAIIELPGSAAGGSWPGGSEDAFIGQLESELEERAAGWLREVLKLSSELEADFLGLGDRLRMRYPQKYDAIEADWNSVLGDLQFDVKASATIDRGHDVDEPPGVSGEDGKK